MARRKLVGLRDIFDTPINEAIVLALGGVAFMGLSYFAWPRWEEHRLPYWLWFAANMGLGAVLMGPMPYFGLGYAGMALIKLVHKMLELEET